MNESVKLSVEQEKTVQKKSKTSSDKKSAKGTEVFYSSVAYLQSSEIPKDIDNLRKKGHLNKLLNTVLTYDQKDSVELNRTYKSPLQNKGDQLLRENKGYAGVYNSSVGGTYEVYRKVPDSVLRKSVERYGLPDNATEEGKQLTLEEKADGFVENNLDIVVAKESGVPQSVLKNVVTQIKQVQSLGKSASTIDFKKSWIKETKSDVSEGTMIFYSSLASFAMYSIFSGVVCVAYMNGNLSEVGRRVMGSSFSKWKFLIYSFATGLMLNVLSNALLLVYITQILKLQLFTNWTGSILLMLIGNIFGLSFGILIGTLQQLSIQGRIIVALMTNMIASAIAGLMGSSIRVFMNSHLPWVNQYNPVALIMSGFYQLNRLNESTQMTRIFGLLGIYTLLLMIFALWRLRRTRYDSL